METKMTELFVNILLCNVYYLDKTSIPANEVELFAVYKNYIKILNNPSVIFDENINSSDLWDIYSNKPEIKETLKSIDEENKIKRLGEFYTELRNFVLHEEIPLSHNLFYVLPDISKFNSSTKEEFKEIYNDLKDLHYISFIKDPFIEEKIPSIAVAKYNKLNKEQKKELTFGKTLDKVEHMWYVAFKSKEQISQRDAMSLLQEDEDSTIVLIPKYS